MEEFTQIATVVMGTVCSITSGGLFLYFIRSTHGVGRAVAFMLGGEAICMIATTVFASSSVIGMMTEATPQAWNAISPEVATALRWLMFLATFLSSVHLSIQVERLFRKTQKPE